MSRAKVCVTGATGFIAGHCIAQLLALGWEVRGTVRSLARPERLAWLRALPGADARLELVEADLLTDGAFDEPARGCELLLHTASPYALDVADPQRDLVAPAVQGTLNVLRAARRAGTVERVVLTSSMAAISDEPLADHVFNEADWNERSSLTRNPYYFSKVEAERAAWRFMDSGDPRFDLVVANPYVVIGPSLGPELNPSNRLLVDLASGRYPVLMDLSWGFVDVRDVALAHVRMLQRRDAGGRYVIAGDETVSLRALVDLLRERGVTGLPTRDLSGPLGTTLLRLASWTQPAGVGSYLRTHLGRVMRYDNGKSKRQLGMTYRPARATIADTLDDLVRHGHLPAPAGAPRAATG